VSDADPAVLAELRRRIQGSFSPGELRALGAALGLDKAEAWDRGADATTRDIVRRALEAPGLEALVEQLRRDRPLVEWSDLLPPARGGDTVVDDVDPGARPTPVAPPPALEPTRPPPGSSGEPGPPPHQGEAAPRAQGPDGPAAPPPASWPMANLAAASPEPRRGVDPHLFAITAACIALAVVVAFAGGVVFSRRGAAPEGAGAGVRADGVAGRAADALDAALVEVARGCGMPAPEAPTRAVLRAAQEQCGHPVAASGRPPVGIDPSTIEPPELEVAPEGRLPPAPGDARRGPRTPAPPKDLCRAGCTAEHRTCKGACGSEPRDASDYAGWQSCQARCLEDESRCRSHCQ
jgi:hypothetical protein